MVFSLPTLKHSYPLFSHINEVFEKVVHCTALPLYREAPGNLRYLESRMSRDSLLRNTSQYMVPKLISKKHTMIALRMHTLVLCNQTLFTLVFEHYHLTENVENQPEFVNI